MSSVALLYCALSFCLFLVAASDEQHSHVPQHRNLVVFLDGSGNDLDLKCSWPPAAICETNIARLYREASKAGVTEQLVHYESGVGTEEGDSYATGTGTRSTAYDAYVWLVDNYREGDHIFLFGFSRGASSARVVQGMINRIGLAKAGYKGEIVQMFEGSDSDAAAFKSDANKTWRAEVHFLGLFDGVLRTLFLKSDDYIRKMRMQISCSTKHFAHAIALEEHREMFQSNKLMYDPSCTDAIQVWFMGLHADVGGGYVNTGASNIVVGWMADQAVDKGLILPTNWEALWNIDVLDDVHVERGLAAYGDIITTNTGRLEVRNPLRCRANIWNNTKIKLHQSILDRMNMISGWEPLCNCCPHIESQMNETAIEYATDRHYQHHFQSCGPTPNLQQCNPPGMWVKVTFGNLSNGKCHDWFSHDDYYVRAQSWHTDVALPMEDGKHAPVAMGCCAAVETHKDKWYPSSDSKAHWEGWSRVYKCSADFGQRSIMIPYENAVATGILVELWEDDFYSADDFAGRVYLDFQKTESFSMSTYTLNHGAQFEVQLEILENDAPAVQSALGSKPQCKWLLEHLDKSQEWFCGHDQGWKVVNHFLQKLNIANADNCDDFLEDITTGV